MYTPEDLQPINRNYIIFGIIFLIVFTFIVYGLVFSTNEEAPKPITATQPANYTNGGNINFSKYDEDSDGDKIPNYMEEFLGTNAYSSEVVDCENNNLTCNESPINGILNINIILDGSTSMNIIGKDKSKFEEIRNGLYDSIKEELYSPYYKFSIYSFGNRGTIGNIPANESCVSVLRHKGLDSQINLETLKSDEYLIKYVPNGKSPLAYSLDQVAKTLNKNEKNLIILITDSLDDCNGDVKRTISEIKNSGLADKIDIATYYSNEDANIYLREAVESNGGNFSQNPEIKKFISESSRNFIKQSWCKFEEVRKVKNCIDSKYKTANSYLNDQKNNRNLGEDEKVKISNVQSVMSFFQESNIRKLQSNLDEEFNNYFKDKDK